jgi:hypothetical protein
MLVLPMRGIKDYAIEIDSDAVKFRKNWFRLSKNVRGDIHAGI